MKAKNDNRPKWYIAACRPNFERQAAEEIVSLGQTVFVPCFRKEFHHRRQRKWIKRYYPLLPGYLFVLASDHWSRILDCEHVNRVLRSQNFSEASVPIAITDVDVQMIRSAQDRGDFDLMRSNRSELKPGDRVTVMEGAFAGQRGTVESIGDENIVLHIEAMCRQVRAVVPLEKLGATG